MENEFLILLQAKLDEAKSKGNINTDIDKIQNQIEKLKLQAEIDPKVFSDLIQKIEGILNQKIDISNIRINQNDVVKSAEQAGQKSGEAFNEGFSRKLKNADKLKSFQESLLNAKMDSTLVSSIADEIGKINVEIESLSQSVSNMSGGKNILSVNIVGIDELGQSVELVRQFDIETGEIVKTIERVSTAQQKTTSTIEKDITTYTNKLKDLQTQYSNVDIDYSEFNKVFDAFKNGEVTVNQLSVAFNELKNSAKASVQNLKSQDKSLDPIQQTINNMRDFPATLKNVETGMNSLKDKTSLAGVSVEELFSTYSKLKAEMDNANGKVPVTDEWVQSYRSLMSTVVELTNKIEALKKAEASDNSAVKLAEQVQTILENTDTYGKTTTGIQLLRDGFTKLGLSADEVKNKMSAVDKEYELLKTAISSGDNSAIVSQFDKVNAVLLQTQNDLKITRSEYSQFVSAQQRLSKANVIEAWNQRNSKATTEVHAANEAYISSLRNLNSQMTKMQFNEIVDGFKRAENSMRGINRLGASLKNQFSQAFQAITQTMSVVNVVRSGVNYIQQMPSVVTELDTSLVDLAKTADMSAKEMEDFYYASNDVAKQMGVTTNEIITQAGMWSRLGFNTAEAATQMAKLSSMFKLISPGMNINDATSGLVSIMKAYGIGVNDVLDGIMSKVNIIGNNFALNNTDIVAMLQDSVSAMAEGNNTLEETIALEMAAFEIVQDQSVGNGFKTVSLRLRGMNEETQELDESLQTIKGDLYDLTGVSVMKDANTYKSTYQILKEISEVWNNLTDKTQAETLELMFGKLRSNIGAAVIKNFSAAEKAMDAMANSAGNAEAEMSIMADSVSYKLNKLQETGTGVAQNLFNRDDMKNVLDVLNSLAEVLDFVTDKIGLFGTIGLGAGIFASVKNVGRPKMSGLFCY